jgi:hypothetical protein
MKTTKIVGAVKEIVADKLREIAEPSEKKINIAKQRVRTLKNELKQAEEEARVAKAEWLKFKKEVITRIRTNDNTIGRFKKKMELSGEKFKVKYQEKLLELERKNHRLKRRVGEYKDDSMEQWQNFKTTVKKNMEEIAVSFKGLKDALLMKSRM